MKKIIFVLISLICLSSLVLAEEKPAGVMIPKLTAAETKERKNVFQFIIDLFRRWFK